VRVGRNDSRRNLAPKVGRSAACVKSLTERCQSVAVIGDTKTPPTTLRFGTFEVDLECREIRKHGMRIRLEEKPFQVLEMLLQQAGHLVTRRALCERLWPDTFVAYEHCLNTAINKVRERLGDSAQNHRFVETIPRRGYRFVLPVEKAGIAASPAGRTMLLVLPFKDLAENPDPDRLSDGLTEELITQLGRLQPERLAVIARTTAMHYKQSDLSIGQIGRELNVSYVLEGSVRRASDRVRIAAQLSQVSDQTHVWAESYERLLGDVFAVQTEVAESVARLLAIELGLGDSAYSSENSSSPVSVLRGSSVEKVEEFSTVLPHLRSYR
jgi:TolB-like protein